MCCLHFQPDFNDPEDFVDDTMDAEVMPWVMRLEPNETEWVESVIVVDGVPIVVGDRVAKAQDLWQVPKAR